MAKIFAIGSIKTDKFEAAINRKSVSIDGIITNYPNLALAQLQHLPDELYY